MPKTNKEFICNIIPSEFGRSFVHKTAREGQKSFRITQQLIQSIWGKSKKLGHTPMLILTLPANKEENYVIRCQIIKEKK